MSNKQRRPVEPLRPDYDNNDPYHGPLNEIPQARSRVPIVPSTKYGDLSFTPGVVQNGAAEKMAGMTEDEWLAWRRALQQAIGHRVEVRLFD